MKGFPALRAQRASLRRKAFSRSLRTQLFEVRVCFPEGGRPLFASGLANDSRKEKEIKGDARSHQAIGKETFWHEGAKTKNEVWLEEKDSLPHPSSLFFGSIQQNLIGSYMPGHMRYC